MSYESITNALEEAKSNISKYEEFPNNFNLAFQAKESIENVLVSFVDEEVPKTNQEDITKYANKIKKKQNIAYEKALFSIIIPHNIVCDFAMSKNYFNLKLVKKQLTNTTNHLKSIENKNEYKSEKYSEVDFLRPQRNELLTWCDKFYNILGEGLHKAYVFIRKNDDLFLERDFYMEITPDFQQVDTQDLVLIADDNTYHN